ncbi:hypothetical protein VMCG_10639 [Cytospora schulzeri]|uniref:Uncharacterized protein n=1 Tax=Cytospora schulzeri TaxID=448051 RepID=A0A423VBB0_9PEZI|nr:hypothetical protein VMCG_10639 [Valsa malicola]
MPPYPSFIANYNLGHPQTSHHVRGYVTSVVAPAAAATPASPSRAAAVLQHILSAGGSNLDATLEAASIVEPQHARDAARLHELRELMSPSSPTSPPAPSSCPSASAPS